MMFHLIPFHLLLKQSHHSFAPAVKAKSVKTRLITEVCSQLEKQIFSVQTLLLIVLLCHSENIQIRLRMSLIGWEGTDESCNLQPSQSVCKMQMVKWCSEVPPDGIRKIELGPEKYMQTRSCRKYTTFELGVGKSGNSVSAWTVCREVHAPTCVY